MAETTQAPVKPSESSSVRGTTSISSDPKDAAPTTEQLVVTRNSTSGEIMKIEVLDDAGKRIEVSQDQIRSIAGVDEIAEIASALDEAFDAGVSMVLEEATGEDESSADDAERFAILRLLMIPLVGRATVRRVARAREGLLRKLFLRRLIRRYASERSVTS